MARSQANPIEIYHPCARCGNDVRRGQGRYEGQYVAELEALFCDSCFPERIQYPREYNEGVERMRPIMAAIRAMRERTSR